MKDKLLDLKFKLRLKLVHLKVATFYRLKCIYWNWRLPKDLNLYLQRWEAIDHRKDKSWSGKDFRLWLYKRKLEQHK